MAKSMLSINPNNRVLQQLVEQMERTPKLLKKELKKTLNKTSNVVKQEMKKEVPQGAKHPIEWTSEKQRRFVMAKLKEEGNLPYRRTNEIVNGWRFRVNAKGGINIGVEFTNISPKARFVIGGDQQKFHANTGWIHANDSMRKHIPRYVDAVEKTYFEVADFTEDIL